MGTFLIFSKIKNVPISLAPGAVRCDPGYRAAYTAPMVAPSWIITALFLADLCIRLALSVRVIMRRRPVGVSLAWLFIILLLPFAGAALYLLLGELRLGKRRVLALRALREPYTRWLSEFSAATSVDWATHGNECEPLAQLAESAAGIPAVPGNTLTLIPDWEQALRGIITDIDGARHSCHMVFYIWHEGGLADQVADALIRASERGVVCRVLLDAVGSSSFLTGEVAQRLRESGVHVESALPRSLLQPVGARFDLRMHRKIVVIDGEIAYTGSLNLVDPRFFKRDADVGQWVDAMARMRGPAVEAMGIVFFGDWELERNEGVDALRGSGAISRPPPAGPSTVQVMPTGPTMEGDAIQILLMAIYAARRELIITTPYFVPDEGILTALVSAARRGVDVTLILPARVDSLLVRFASQPHMGELLVNGVNIMLFSGGLLHTKSMTVDGEISLFGSLNMDPRSIYLNFEITLSIYDRQFTRELIELQRSYIEESTPMKIAEWERRSRLRRFRDNVARLLSPLL